MDLIISRRKNTLQSSSQSEHSQSEQAGSPSSASSLCKTCECLNISQFSDPEFIFKHKSFPAITKSATTCPSCAIIISAKDTVRFGAVPLGHLVTPLEEHPVLLSGRMDSYIGLDESGDEGVQLCLTGIHVGIPAKHNSALKSMLQLTGPMVGGQLSLFVEGNDTALRERIFGRPYSDSADDLSRAISWYKWCQADHPGCAFPAGESRRMPTRLLDVGSPDGLEEPCLLETTTDQRDEYLALTYCWGDAKMTTTTTKNISEHKQEIKFERLSKVFQDAVIATRKLGFRYIWIDALCILQDSKSDWEKEAALMTEVYSNAAITISAAVSASGDEGLFTPRQPLNAVSLPFKGINDTPNGSCFLTAVSARSFGDDVLKGPLSERAWTLQERLLSRRILHFGRDQLHWECQKTIRSEDFDATSSRFFGNRIYLCLTEKLHQQNPHSGGATPYFVWYYIIVREYTNRRLTYQKDILMAILGIANIFRARLHDRYVWGLWERDLPRGLLWNTGRNPSGHPSELNAPSWSWLSVANCPMGYILPCMIEEIVVEDWSVAGEPDEFGVTRPGTLSLVGPVQLLEKLQPVKPNHRLIDYEYQSLECVIDYRDLDMGDRSTFFSWYLSEDDVKLGRKRRVDIYCLLVALMSCEEDEEDNCAHRYCNQTRGMALLLLRVEGEDTYKRIGSVQVRQADFKGVEKRRIKIV